MLFLQRVFNFLKRGFSRNLIKSFYCFCNKIALLNYAHSKEIPSNFGDAINPWLFTKVTYKKCISRKKAWNWGRKSVYYFMGSILDNLNDSNAVICGAGFISSDAEIHKAPKNVLAVRGPLSREILIKNNIECPEVYCDPALLLPDFYDPKVDKKYDVGIIPHYADKQKISQMKIDDGNLKSCFIDIESSLEAFVSSLKECRMIVSSSLHGVICAHAYGIPAVWMKLSDNLLGGNFKFKDYFYSIGIQNPEPYIPGDNIISINAAASFKTDYQIKENATKYRKEMAYAFKNNEKSKT